MLQRPVVQFRGRYKYLLIFVAVVLAWCIGLSLPRIGFAPITIGLIALVLAGWTLHSPIVGIIALLVLTPFHSTFLLFIKGDVILTTWRDILFLLVLASWGIGVSQRKFRIVPHYFLVALLIWTVWIGIGSTRLGNMGLALLAFRGNVRYLMLLPVVMSLLDENELSIRPLLNAIVFAGFVLSLINLFVYYTGTSLYGPIVYPIRYLGNTIAIRRMLGIFGGPSNLGTYLAVCVVIVYVKLMSEQQPTPKWWLVATAPMLVCLFLTVSYDAWGSLLLAALALYIAGRWHVSRKFWHYASLLLLFILLLILLALASTGIAVDRYSRGTSLTDYFLGTFWSGMTLQGNILGITPGEFVLGSGPLPVNLTSGIDVGGFSTGTGGLKVGPHDNAWARLAQQLGFPVTGLIFLSFVVLFVRVFRWLRTPQPNHTMSVVDLKAAWVSCLVLFTSVHLPRWMQIGADVNFPVLLGILAFYDYSWAASSQQSAEDS